MTEGTARGRCGGQGGGCPQRRRDGLTASPTPTSTSTPSRVPSASEGLVDDADGADCSGAATRRAARLVASLPVAGSRWWPVGRDFEVDLAVGIADEFGAEFVDLLVVAVAAGAVMGDSHASRRPGSCSEATAPAEPSPATAAGGVRSEKRFRSVIGGSPRERVAVGFGPAGPTSRLGKLDPRNSRGQ